MISFEMIFFLNSHLGQGMMVFGPHLAVLRCYSWLCVRNNPWRCSEDCIWYLGFKQRWVEGKASTLTPPNTGNVCSSFLLLFTLLQTWSLKITQMYNSKGQRSLKNGISRDKMKGLAGYGPPGVLRQTLLLLSGLSEASSLLGTQFLSSTGITANSISSSWFLFHFMFFKWGFVVINNNIIDDGFSCT